MNNVLRGWEGELPHVLFGGGGGVVVEDEDCVGVLEVFAGDVVEVVVLAVAGEKVVAVLGCDVAAEGVGGDLGDDDVEQGGGDEGALGVDLGDEVREGVGEWGGEGHGVIRW